VAWIKYWVARTLTNIRRKRKKEPSRLWNCYIHYFSMCSIMVHLYLCVCWPCYVYLKWLHTRQSRLYVLTQILNMCIGAYVYVCLIMCAYWCLCIRIWLYDTLKCRNLGNYAPVFEVINNVRRSLPAKRVTFLISLITSGRIEWLYVDGCM